MLSTKTHRHLLALDELTAPEIRQLLATAIALKGHRLQLAQGQVLGLLFTKPSTRTRVSFEVAMAQLGGQSMFLSAEATQLSRGESLAHTARVLGRYLSVIAMRTHAQQDVDLVAAESGIPVINALTERFHPMQVLADLLTVQCAKGQLEGLTYAYLGDGNNMANTWVLAQAILGLELRVATPPGFAPHPAVLSRPQVVSHPPQLYTDPLAAIEGADVVITDTWVSMGMEEEAIERARLFAPYQVNAALMSHAASDAMFLHCLPAHVGEEVTEDVIEGPHSAVWDEAENRLHVQKAWLATLLGGA
ncbi:MAG: ornithine carbamoyltransferase [Sulfobacillus sp.]